MIELIYSPKNPEDKRPVQILKILIDGKVRKTIKGIVATLICGYLSRDSRGTKITPRPENKLVYDKILSETLKLLE